MNIQNTTTHIALCSTCLDDIQIMRTRIILPTVSIISHQDVCFVEQVASSTHLLWTLWKNNKLSLWPNRPISSLSNASIAAQNIQVVTRRSFLRICITIIIIYFSITCEQRRHDRLIPHIWSVQNSNTNWLTHTLRYTIYTHTHRPQLTQLATNFPVANIYRHQATTQNNRY